MAFYTYGHACDGEHVYRWTGMSIIAKRDEPRQCPNCGIEDSFPRVIPVLSFSFSEVDKIGESTKPDSYWENAESEKRRKLIKEQNQTLEKAFYNDPSCPEKYKKLKKCVK